MKTKDRILTVSHYTYLEPVNAKFTRAQAKKWGSGSNYINHLIAQDRGDKQSVQRSLELQATFFAPAPKRAPRTKKAGKKAKGKKSRAAKKPGGKKVASKNSKAQSSPSSRKKSSSKTNKVVAINRKAKRGSKSPSKAASFKKAS